MKLTKGMYGHEFNSKKDEFGLCCGQMRSREYFHNAGWYNKNGEKIGWGDLSESDIQTIAKKIDPDELFIVLNEGDSFWNFVIAPGIIGSMAVKDGEKEYNPGLNYVLEHAQAIITKNAVYYVTRWGRVAKVLDAKDNVTYESVESETAKEFVINFLEKWANVF